MMERELKFRSWDGKQMLIFDLSRDREMSIHASRLQIAWFSDCVQRGYPIMQFTGKKDRKGVEIYESDIIMGEDNERCLVEWDNDSAGFTINGYSFDPKYFEVVGNIHENKDMLKDVDAPAEHGNLS